MATSEQIWYMVLEADMTELASSSFSNFIGLDAFDFRKQKIQC